MCNNYNYERVAYKATSDKFDPGTHLQGAGYQIDHQRPLFNARIKVTKHSSKKNSNKILRAGNRYFVGKNKETQSLLADLAQKLSIYKTTTITEPVRVEITIFTNTLTKKNVRSKKIIDLDNAAQGPIDALQKADILEDDNLIDELLLKRIHSNTEELEVTIWLKI